MDETERIESPETQGLAWSKADIDNLIPYIERPTWGRWILAGVGFAVVAVGAFVFGQHQYHQPQTPAAPNTPAAAPEPPQPPVAAPVQPPTAPPPIVEPPDAQPVDRDALYFNLLQTADVHFSTPAAAIYNGHLVCEALDRGDSLQTVINDNVAKSPAVDPIHVGRGVRAAVVAYCPQYEK